MTSRASSAAGAAPGPTAPTTGSLLERARAGDRAALGELVGRCLPRLRRWAHGRLPQWARSLADTRDLVQDAALHTLRRFGAIDVGERQALAAYLRQAVQNRVRDEQRRVVRRGPHDAPVDRLAASQPSPLDHAVMRETEARYRAALTRLHPIDRELIVAHLELDYTHEQLACMTGRSRHAARMALSRAVRRLADAMRQA